MCILISQPFTYNSAFAHNAVNPTDPPGASSPKIKVTVTLDSITLHQNMDDPTEEGDAELAFSYAFNHAGHDQSFSGSEEIDFNYQVYTQTTCYSEARPDKPGWMCYRFLPNPTMTFKTPKVLYEHTECTPMSQIAYAFDLRESDQSIANTVASGLLTVAGIVASIPAYGWAAGSIAAGVGGLITIAVGLNGDEHLGIQVGVQNGPQTNIVTVLNGADGGSDIRWSVKTESVDDPEGQCRGTGEKQVGSLLDNSNRQDQYALAQTIDKFILASKNTISLNPSSQKETDLKETSDSEFEKLKGETPSKVLAFTEDVYQVLASQLDEKSNISKFSNEAKTLVSQKKYDEALDAYKQTMLELVSNESQTKQTALPDWIKQNAKWWSDGTTTDREFANSIGFLVKEKIITVNVPTNNDGTIFVNENLQIPDWLRNNAKWWSDEIISDQEFTSGIEFMIKQKIITFSEKNSVSDKFDELYTISKRNEAITSSLIEINQYEKKILRDVLDDAWEKYNKSKNPDDLKSAQIFDENLKSIEKRILVLSKTELLAKQDTQSLLKNAAKDGIKIIDLEKSTKGKIWTKIRPDTPEKLVQALKDVENANKQQIKDLEKTLDTLLFGPGTTSKDGKKVSPLDSDLFDSSQFFKDYFVVTDHIPIQAVFDDNWTELQETEIDAKVLDEFVFDESFDWQDETKDNTETKDEQISETPLDGKQVSVLVINGKYYPYSQFFDVPAHQPNCDSIHYHTEFPQVRSVDGVLLSDPNPSTCGFGKVSLIPIDVITMTQEQLDSFKAAMGFEP